MCGAESRSSYLSDTHPHGFSCLFNVHECIIKWQRVFEGTIWTRSVMAELIQVQSMSYRWPTSEKSLGVVSVPNGHELGEDWPEEPLEWSLHPTGVDPDADRPIDERGGLLAIHQATERPGVTGLAVSRDNTTMKIVVLVTSLTGGLP